MAGLRGARFLVTGAAGFIGSNLVEHLLELGASVTGVDNFITGKRENIEPFEQRMTFVEGDVRDLELCRELCGQVDYVLHQAALGSVPRSIDDPSYARVREVAVAALGALGLRSGMSHMEWFLRQDGSVAISEVGARPPGAQFTSLLSYAHDLDFYVAWGRLMATGHFEPPPRRWAVGALYLRGQGAGRVRAVRCPAL